MSMSRWGWSPYVSVAQRKAKAHKQMDKLRKKGQCILPVKIEGRTIARSFWGKGWCNHLESFSDYENRLPRGRTYVRNGSVCHLEIASGKIQALVSGTSMYTVNIEVKTLPKATWEAIKGKCAGQIGSILELLQGKLSDQVMAIVAHRQDGLFPLPGEFSFSCSCPDWASMCKHVAATLYGVGHRLDTDPSLLFQLRGVDAQELIAAELALPDAAPTDLDDALGDEALADIFGIEMDTNALSTSTRTQTTPSFATKKSKAAPMAKVTKAKPAAPAPKPHKTQKPAPGPFTPTGPRIKKLRLEAGLSVAEFARRLDVSAPTIYRWEKIRGKLALQSRCLAFLQHMHEARALV